MKRFLVNENNVIWCKTVQLLIGGSLLLLSPQNVFAAPNDFDGDGKSDFAVARQFDPGAAGDPCKALAIPVWANCNTNVRLYQNTFFIKSSSAVFLLVI